jgi:hypothetical protein
MCTPDEWEGPNMLGRILSLIITIAIIVFIIQLLF